MNRQGTHAFTIEQRTSRAEALCLLDALARWPDRLEAAEQAEDVIAVYRTLVGAPDPKVLAAYRRAVGGETGARVA